MHAPAAHTAAGLHASSSLPARRSVLCRPRPALHRHRQRTPRAHAIGVLRKQYSFVGQDQLEGLMVSQEHLDGLTKQLEKLNWAVYLVNDPPALASGSDDSLPESKDDDCVYHFAYGANMNSYTLIRREVRALSRDPAKLANMKCRMVFKHRGGYATIEEVDNAADVKYSPYSRHVHGVLYRISKSDLKKLEQREGGYVLREMEVETYDGRLVTAWVFVSGRLSKLREEVAPTEKYMRKLREGASDNYLDPVYQAWLSSIETVPSAGLPQEYWNTPSKYFAYGFLCIVACILSGFFFRH